MHSFVAFLFGMMCAWALPQSSKYPPLGRWRALAGGLAAIFPHIEEVFLLLGSGKSTYIQFLHSVTWNPFLVPLYSLLLAVLMAKLIRHSWQALFPIMLISMMFSSLLAMFTLDGVKIFYPINDFTIAFSSLYTFDLTILGLALLVLALDFVLPRWSKDLSRFGMLCIVVYIGIITTFAWRAEEMAEQYAEALNLKTKAIYTIPQPISSMNWRLIVKTKDDRMHDTMVNIGRQEGIEISDTSNRATRINALYKPVDKAVWRIYRRFGSGEDKSFIKDVWHDQPEWLQHYTRFHVFRRLSVKNNMPCVEFKDLRTIGARNTESGLFISCKTKNGTYSNSF
jgi:hypothetical protein